MCFPQKSDYQSTVIFQDYTASLPSIKRYPHWSKIQHSSSLIHRLIDLTLNNLEHDFFVKKYKGIPHKHLKYTMNKGGGAGVGRKEAFYTGIFFGGFF